MTSPTPRSYYRAEKSSVADDWLQLLNPNQKVVGGIDPNGVPYGSLSGGSGPTPGNPTPDWFNVKNYGAKGDAKTVTDGETAGSDIVLSATANFTESDIGKVIYGISPGVGNPPVYVYGLIDEIVSPSEVIVTASTFSGGHPGLKLVWGTDDTAALQAAWAAALAAPARSTVYVPAGGYIFSKVCFVGQPGNASPNLLGDGPYNTAFYPSPNFDFSTFTGNFGMLNYWNGSGGFEIGNFSVDGAFISYPGGHVGYVVDLSGWRYAHDITVASLGDVESSFSSIGGIGATAGIQGFWQDLFALGCNNPLFGGYGSGIFVNGGGGCMLRCEGSNGTLGQYIANINQGTSFADVSDYLCMIGCLNDEGGSFAQVKFVNCSHTSVHGCAFWGNFASNPCEVDATSDVSFFGCTLGPFSYRVDGNGLVVDAGGTARCSGCRIHKTTTGVGLINAGTFYDLGGNIIDSISNTGTIISWTPQVATPVTAGSAGVAGQISYDATHIYVCVATNTWVRATLATF